MTAITIEEVLCGFLKKEVADKTLVKKICKAAENANAEPFVSYVHPEVYRGYLPIENADRTTEDSYPFIIVRCLKVFNGTTKNNVQRVYAMVRIVFGIYCDDLVDEDQSKTDGSGHADLWNIMEKTRTEMFSRMVIDGKVCVEYDDFSMNIVEEQSMPYWDGYITLKVCVNEAEPTVPFKNVFGKRFFE